MTTKEDKYVWIVAGGIMQIPLIKEVKSRGYKIILSDGNLNAPGSEFADTFIRLDTYDIQGHIDISQVIHEKPIAVLAAGADVGPTVSAIAEELNLPAERLDVALRCRNKLSVRETLKAPHPAYTRMDFSELSPHTRWKVTCARFNVEPYPCVVKPLEKAGSRGISLVRNAWGWTSALRKARLHDNRMNRACIVEKFILGAEYATDWMVKDGNVKFLNGVYRRFDKKVFGLERAHFNPWKPPREVYALVKDTVDKLGVTFGPFKCDLIYNSQLGWVVIETATRLSGGFDHMYAAKHLGKDITGVMVDVALGKGINARKITSKSKDVICTYAPIFPPGEVKEFHIPDDKNLVDHFVTRKTIKPLENCSQRPLFLQVKGKSYESAYMNALRLEKRIEVEYAE